MSRSPAQQQQYHNQLLAHHKQGAISPGSVMPSGTSTNAKSGTSPSDSSGLMMTPGGGGGPGGGAGGGNVRPGGGQGGPGGMPFGSVQQQQQQQAQQQQQQQQVGPPGGPTGPPPGVINASQGVQPNKVMMPPPSPRNAMKEADSATNKSDGSPRGPLTPGSTANPQPPALSPSQILASRSAQAAVVNGASGGSNSTVNSNSVNGAGTSRPATASTNPSATTVQTPVSVPATIPAPIPTTATSGVSATNPQTNGSASTTPIPPSSNSSSAAPQSVSTQPTSLSNFSELGLDTMGFEDFSMFSADFGLPEMNDDFAWLTEDLPHGI